MRPIITAAVLLAWVGTSLAQGQATSLTTEQLSERFDQPLTGLESPPIRDVHVYGSELTPAVIFRSRLSEMTLLHRMGELGLDGPSHVAYVAGGEVRTGGRGQIGQELDEPWLVVWFQGGRGWVFRHCQYVQRAMQSQQQFQFDVPMLIRLQHRPESVTVDAEGVHLVFADEAGIVQIMPLFGVNRPSMEDTAGWAENLPEGVVSQARRWSAWLSSIPVQVVERYRIDPAEGMITLIHNFRYVDVEDDWDSDIHRAAPVAPAIALAAGQGMDLTFTDMAGDAVEPIDAWVPTVFGPVWMVPGESVEIHVPGILELVTRVRTPNVEPGADSELIEGIRGALRGRINETGMGWWAAAGAAMSQGNKAEMLPFADDELATQVRTAAMRMMHQNVFGGVNTTEQLVDEQRERIYLVDYVNHYQRYAGDDEAPAAEILRGSFNYAFNTGDWASIRQNWQMLRQAGVASYVKNNWIIQSRPNSGGDTFHDVIVGTAAMARMAAVLGEEDDFGFFSYLLARHLIAYHGFEYSALQHARQYQPWFTPVAEDRPMVVWDIYGPFGAFFSLFDAEGYYGSYTGFYEHYFRMDEDVMPRYYARHLPDHVASFFGQTVLNEMPNPDEGETNKWMTQLDIRAYYLNWSHDQLRQWLDSVDFRAENTAHVLMALYNGAHPPELVDILHPDLNRPFGGEAGALGVHLQSDGLGHQNFMLDTRTYREPGLFWFGFNTMSPNRPELHSGNGVTFGVTNFGDGRIVNRDNSAPNWVTRGYSFNISAASAAARQAEAEQADAEWMILGPFGRRGHEGDQFDTAFGPEDSALPPNFDAVYRDAASKPGEDGAEDETVDAQWQSSTMAGREDDRQLPPYTLSCRWGFNHFGYTYLYTRVRAPQAMDVRFGISTNGGHKVWVNGELANENRRGNRTTDPDAEVFAGRLEQGWNDILIKLRNSTFWERMYFRVMDENEQAIPGLVFDPTGR